MAVQSPKDIQLYTGSMDSDTELRYIRQGDYVKLLNGRSSITNGQNFGAVEDAEGNYLVLNKYYFEFQNQQPGYSKVIGSYEDLTYNSIIYFVYNSSGNHGIYRYFPKKDDGAINVIEKIYAVENPSIYDKFNKSPLNFQEDHLITGVNLVENLLFFNDGYNQPKQIDIERCNEENKKRIYALYVNNNELINRKQNNQLGAFNFNLSVTDQSLASTLYTFTYIFGSFDLADVITDLCNQINNLTNAPFYAENKLNYIEIVFKNTGKYFLSVSNDGQFQSRALPLNFYYNDLPEHFFNRIQFPPFCRPNAQFIPVEEPDDNPLQINLNQSIINWTWNEFPVNSGFYTGERFALLGFPSELNDAYNQSTLGASYINSGLVYSISTINTSYLNGQLIYNNANAYFIPRPQGESITIDLSYQCNQNDFTVNTGSIFGPPTEDITARFQIDLIGVNASGNIGFTKNILTKTGNTSISSASLIVPVNIPSGLQNYRFLLRVIGNNGTCGILTGGFIAFDGITYADISNLPKSTNNIYRSKYVFENYQSSVYGQATTTILRTKGYYFQDQVEINYRDKFLSDDNFASRIKNVILSYSDDNGTNWYDYETLEPYQFACEGSTSIFDNTKLGIPVDEATAILQYHSVPLSARSQEYADDRIWEGGLVEGYDKIDVDFKVEYVYEQLYQTDIPIYQGTPISLQGFKIGHTGYIGIVYYDDFDRKSPVCIGPNSKIQFLSYDDLYPTGQNFTDYEYIPSLKISIYNDPPEWATKYRIVRTKDFSNTNYLFWRINSYATIDENGVVTPINPVYYKISLDNLTYYVNTGAIGAKVNYVFQDGDRIKILSDALGDKLSQTYDLQIEGSDANYIYLKYDPSIPIGDGSLIEIYSKSQNVGIENSLYYEMGECFEIKVGDFNGVKKKYHTGSVSVNNSDQIYLATNAVSPAIIQTYNGGCYYRYRKLYRFYNVSGYTLDNIQAWIPSNYADEYTVSGYDGLTRPNTVNIIGQLERPTAFRFTNQYNLTKINGLNENEPLNEQQLSTQYGWLEKIILVNNDVLRLIFRNSYQMSIYVSQGVIRQAQGDVSLISVTDQVAGNSHIIQKTLGTQNPESVYVNDDGDVFGYDEQEGVVWRSSGNGLIQISDYKQKNNFKNWSVERSERNLLKSKTPSVYDIYHDEYILTANDLPAVTSTPNCVTFDLIGPPKTITYDLTLIVEETGEVFISQTGLPGNIEPNQYIKSVFDNLPIWTTKSNSDGTVTVCTLSSNYRDKTFSIQYKVNGVITGPELLRNGDFLEDNAINNTWTNSGWILVSVPDPNFLIGATCLQVFAGNYLLSQQNVGFIPGETIVITLDCVVNSGTFEVRLGNTPGAQYAQTINTTGVYSFQLEYPQDSTDIIRIETYFQNPPDIYIKSISAKRPILQNDTYFKYPVINGIIGPEEEIVDWEGRTIAFNKQKNGWTHYYSFVPEYYGRLRDQIVSFKNGDLWVHSQLAFPKNYYGVQYGRELTIVVNKDFPKVKQFKALSINGLRKNNVPEIVIPPYEGLSTGMLSELTENHFSVAEGIQYAAIQKDKLTPGYANTDLAWVNGRNMLGQIMTAKIVNNEPFTSVIYNVDILYFYSENS